MTVILVILLVVALIVVCPLAVIWALNTLFPEVGIPYDFPSWAAVVVLCLIFNGGGARKS